jgi:hypothetical protein
LETATFDPQSAFGDVDILKLELTRETLHCNVALYPLIPDRRIPRLRGNRQVADMQRQTGKR